MTTISPLTRRLLALSMLKGVGPAALRKAAARPSLDDDSIDELARAIPQIARALVAGSWESALDAAEKQIDEAMRSNARILSPKDDDYPKLLASTKDDPFLIFVQGSLAKIPEQSVAIIGTREPTYHGTVIARRITQFFVERNWSIVSGLAIGCDGIAHQAALEFGGHTVAVLAHGLHMIAPARHRKLAEAILSAGGALVSEYPFGQGVQNQQYVKRDRTQAGMAQGVVMIQSDVKGGSLHASRASLDYGRWLAVPYPTDRDRDNVEPKVQANLLIADGADAQRAELLHCATERLKNVLILRGKEDYLLMTEQFDGTPENRMPGKRETREVGPGHFAEKSAGTSSAALPLEVPSGGGTGEFAHASSSDDGSVRENVTDARVAQVTPGGEACGNVLIYRIPAEDLTISLIPEVLFEKQVSFETKVDRRAPLDVLSARLKYIQLRLDDINSSRRELERGTNNGILLTHLHFAIEDVVAQMKRAEDLLGCLEKSNQRGRSQITSGDFDHESALGACFRTGSKGDSASLSDMLKALVDSFSLRLIRTAGPQLGQEKSSVDGFVSMAEEVVPGDRTVGIFLHDLVDSFNRRVAKTVFSESRG